MYSKLAEVIIELEKALMEQKQTINELMELVVGYKYMADQLKSNSDKDSNPKQKPLNFGDFFKPGDN